MKKKIVVLLTLLVAVFLAIGSTVALAETGPAPVVPGVIKGETYTYTDDGAKMCVEILGDTTCWVHKDGELEGVDCTYTYANERLTLKQGNTVFGVFLIHEKTLIDVTAFETVIDKVPEEHKEEVRKGVDEFYAWIKPYLGYGVAFGVGGIIVGFIVWLIAKRLIKVFETNYEAKRIAKTFVEEIGKQDISLDVSAVVETKLDGIRKELVSDIQPVVDNFAVVQNAVAYLCAAMSNSKVVPTEIRDELAEQAKNLNSSAVCKKKEVVKLQLAKVPTVEKADDEKATAEGLFGGYNET